MGVHGNDSNDYALCRSDPRIPEDENCPGYGGDNKTKTYAPAKICNGVTDVVPIYSGGFGAPAGFEAKNFGTEGGQRVDWHTSCL